MRTNRDVVVELVKAAALTHSQIAMACDASVSRVTGLLTTQSPYDVPDAWISPVSELVREYIASCEVAMARGKGSSNRETIRTLMGVAGIKLTEIGHRLGESQGRMCGGMVFLASDVPDSWVTHAVGLVRDRIAGCQKALDAAKAHVPTGAELHHRGDGNWQKIKPKHEYIKIKSETEAETAAAREAMLSRSADTARARSREIAETVRRGRGISTSMMTEADAAIAAAKSRSRPRQPPRTVIELDKAFESTLFRRRGVSPAAVGDLVSAYLDKGGQVTRCEPGIAWEPCYLGVAFDGRY